MELKLVHVSDPGTVAAIGRLRAEVWRQELDTRFREFGDTDCWTDSVDEVAYHWAVYLDGSLVAAARLSLHTSSTEVPYGHVFTSCGVGIFGKVASINRLVVKREARGLGIARALDRVRLAKARELGAEAILAVPVGESRTKALASLGYVSVANDLDPSWLGIPLENARVSVMVAPLASLMGQSSYGDFSESRWSFVSSR